MEYFDVVTVELGDRSYSAYVGNGLTHRLMEFLPTRAWRKVALVTDSNVGPLHLQTVADRLKGAGLEINVLEVPAGESSKSAENALELIERFVSFGINRSDVVVALGGGVVGDLSGFAASVFKRGIDLVHVPTSLMAQVDSSVGGKTAVNIAAAKNQIGTFHQPVIVVCDVDYLDTLPDRELVSGMAEIAKYSFLTRKDWRISFRNDAHSSASRGRPPQAELIAECIREKADIVSVDERDIGVRRHLNYGHTIGHAIEAATGYDGTYSHGEAVSVGMMFSALVSEALALTPTGLAARHARLLSSLGLPVIPRAKEFSFADLAPLIAMDKKSSGDIAMVLLEEEGKPVVKTGLDRVLLEDCYDRLLQWG